MGGRRRVSKISRLKGVGRLAAGSIQLGVGVVGFSNPSPLGKVSSAVFGLIGSRNIVIGGRQAFARSGSRGSGSGGRQKGHPFYGNQYVNVSARNKARKR